MIIDTSAVVAALFAESDHDRVVKALLDGGPAAAGSPTVFEAELVICGQRGAMGRETVRGFLDEFDIDEIPFDPEHRREASSAFLRFGKGRHPAGLNFGDCMTYAIAKLAEQPLLCVGEDFAKTDLNLVLPPG